MFNIFAKRFFYQLYAYKTLSFLKYDFFVNLFVTDAPTEKYRFLLRYCLQSLRHSGQINILTQINECSVVNSVASLFYGAGWPEREAWDMFGIFFTNHNNMNRLLVDYGFSGYPLRKDFPVAGYIELFYNEGKARIFYNKVDFVQEHKNFYFDKLWY